MGTFHDRHNANNGRLARDFETSASVVVGSVAAVQLIRCQLGDDYKRRAKDNEDESDRVYVRHLKIGIDPDSESYSGVTAVKDREDITVVDGDYLSGYVVTSVRIAHVKFLEIKMERISRVSYGRKVSGR